MTALPTEILRTTDGTVNVTRESEWKRQGRFMRTCFSNQPEPTRITFDQLYETLAHGEPGEYILLGA